MGLLDALAAGVTGIGEQAEQRIDLDMKSKYAEAVARAASSIRLEENRKGIPDRVTERAANNMVDQRTGGAGQPSARMSDFLGLREHGFDPEQAFNASFNVSPDNSQVRAFEAASRFYQQKPRSTPDDVFTLMNRLAEEQGVQGDPSGQGVGDIHQKVSQMVGGDPPDGSQWASEPFQQNNQWFARTTNGKLIPLEK